MEISRIIWLEDIVDKLRWKHNVEESEVIEVLESRPKFQYKEKGYKPGEDVYAAFGQRNLGRLLSVFFCLYQRQTSYHCFSKRYDNKRKGKTWQLNHKSQTLTLIRR